MATESGRRIVFFSHPRTASNLILKILNLAHQPDILFDPELDDHNFVPAIKLKCDAYGSARRVSDWSEAERSAMSAHYQKSLDKIVEYAARASNEGKIAFLREHVVSVSDPVAQYCCYTGCSTDGEDAWRIAPAGGHDGARTQLNCTLIPDEILRQWFPIFVIRHPASAFSSYYRVLTKSDSSEAKTMQQATLVNRYSWTRSLHDCYKRSFGIQGIVLDADDVIADPQLLRSVSSALGLHPEKLKFNWTATRSPEEIAAQMMQNPRHVEFMETLDKSTGIVKDKMRAAIDVEQERRQWENEFGVENGKKLGEWVAAAMEDYEYLARHKFVK